ncbi:dermonecrotic toxin domain-containing protein [Pseudomonas agarici]|uniref:dermonecrotic toxin domain-containing protein n=1 Tax=Pseudomonas agarici TaxID=46677 RepID=UPI0015A1B964|nr:DUF6543 domain-containing protein [Pseudomonas agarici]NWB94017.1 hypothetical protein [Pseudomonas agarici]
MSTEQRPLHSPSLPPRSTRNHRVIISRLPSWLTQASLEQRREFAARVRLSQTSKTALARLLTGFKSVKAFAAPLLSRALDERYGPGLDIHYDRLKHVHILAAATLGQPRQETVIVQSLLQVALQNFAISETGQFGFDRGSAILRKTGGLLKRPITPPDFAALCRRLDLGGQYQKHLERHLGPLFDTLFEQHERDELAVQAQIALMKGVLDLSADRMLHSLLDPAQTPRWDNRPVQCSYLTLLDFTNASGYRGCLLKGVMLIERDGSVGAADTPCLVYLSGDPQHPLKSYPSVKAFHDELRERLRNKPYQAFFKRYLHLRDQPAFFHALEARLNPLNPTTGQRQPAVNADLLLEKTSLLEKPFHEFCRLQVVKIFDDARVTAVPTGDEDKKTRLARLKSLLNWTINLLFLVPGLGEPMLAVVAAQLLVQVYNGIEQWNHDEKEQAVLGFIGVVLNLELLGLGAALTVDFQGSSFIEELKPVKSPQGDQALWKPDLGPYEQTLPDRPSLQPGASGLYHHQGKTWLAIDGRHYRLRPGATADSFHLQHPGNPNAYTPQVFHNGKGAWLHEFEQPMQWKQPQLFSRLGPDAASLDPVSANRIMQLSGVDDGVLRRLHLDQEPPPALLEDSVTRFKLDRDLKHLVQRLQNGGVADSSLDELQMELQLLTSEPVWPRTKVLRLLDHHGAALTEYPAGQAQALPRIDLRWPGLDANQLLRKVLENLDETEIRGLLGEDFGAGPISLDARTVSLRRKLAAQAANRRAALFDSHYRYRTQSRDRAAAVIQRDFPTLSTPIAEELARHANPSELKCLFEARRVPLRVAEEARHYGRNLRLARAWEGLYLDATHNGDSDRLILRLLEKLPGWSNRLRLEIRESSFGGALLYSLGALQAPIRKVLVRNGELYEAYDALGQELHGPDDLYSCVLHALPDAERKALGFPGTHEADRLKQTLLALSLPSRAELEKILGLAPIKPGYVPPMRLADGRIGYPLSGRGVGERLPGTRSARFTELAQSLYPTHSSQAVEAFLALRGLNEGAAVQRLEQLEAEYNTLRTELKAWVYTPPGPPECVQIRGHIARSIKACWRREPFQRATQEGYKLHFVLYDPTMRLPNLSADFSHVSELLMSLAHPDIALGLNTFLSRFPQLNRLYISGGALAEIPPALGSMTRLTHLNLSGNRIVLSPETATLLSGLTHLRELTLAGNTTLGRSPDLSRMLELIRIDLGNTGLTAWPTGYERLPALTRLDLRSNRLTTIPDSVLDTSDEGQRIARALNLYGNPIESDYLEDASEYHALTDIDFGLDLPSDSDPDADLSSDDEPAHSPLGSPGPASRDERPWLPGLDGSEQEDFRNDWLQLASEEPITQSEAFFRVIGDLEESADYGDETARTSLIDKVRRMVRAAMRDTKVREQLFAKANSPQTDACADGIAVAFSDMGFDVLLHEAYAEPDVLQIEAKLLRLARGKSRLDRVNAQARILINKRKAMGRHPDEAEIYLAYRIGLAERLELPWQASKMLYGDIAGINQAQLDEAYQAILDQERQPMDVVGQIVKQEFWKEYLDIQYLQELSEKEALRNYKGSALLDLQAAQERWFNNGNLSADEKTALQTSMKALADILGQSEQQVFAQAMTDAEYLALYESIGRETTDEMERLTQQALGEHGLSS